jgi:glucuronokinase
MLLLRRCAHARAGLIGNPSDGYHGKTISLIVRNFRAEVILYEWQDVELIWSQEDQSRFRTVQELVADVRQHGYYGGIRLVKATIKQFVEYCDRKGLPLHDQNFSVRYHTTIPRQVGLAGSSAIIVATLRCLMEFYQVAIPSHLLASLALAVETEELSMPAGLQDRVIQVYEGLVYMDFAADRMREEDGYRYGVYEALDPALLPPLYIAYKDEVGKPLQPRLNRDRADVLHAMSQLAALTEQAREALLARDHDRLAQLMNQNFDIRRSIYQLPPAHVEMVEVARGVGASAKFAGSGGAIIGTYRDEAMFQALRAELGKINCVVLKPIVSLA